MDTEQQKHADHGQEAVLLVWGGTGASKKENVKPTDTAEAVFGEVYKRFKQKRTEQDTYQVGQQDFPAVRFTETVAQLLAAYPNSRPLEFEVIPPTSGA